MKIYLFIFSIFCFSISALKGQSKDYRAGQFIVQLIDNQSIIDLQKKCLFIDSVEMLVAPLSIYRVFFNEKADEQALLKTIRQQKMVVNAQFNHILELRNTTPNDPNFTQQWHHLNVAASSGGITDADIDSDEAWDIARGGVTTDGDTIVVAVIDNGTSLNHLDLLPNHWFNRQEIPQNGIDDDQNGYIDDYNGWNAAIRTDDVDGGNHGTEVEGVIGAVGNNARGVSGVNWAVKLMTIFSDGEEATIIASYGYVLAQRRLYNKTNGRRGAFVVATNSSFGLPNKTQTDAPLWCAMYDSLGLAGILSVGATANSNVNVDIVGDLPSTCQSDYLIIATSTDNRDVKGVDAAFGPVNVDVAAPGVGIWTTAVNGDYTSVRGTSVACPMVTGIAALSYAVACNDFINFSKSNPAAATLYLKNKILESVEIKPDLQGKIRTNGRVNAAETLRRIKSYCGTCQQAARVKIDKTTTTATISMALPLFSTMVSARFRKRNETNWNVISENVPPLSISALEACTEYELELKTMCNGTLSTPLNLFFKTDGCCNYPDNIVIFNVLQNKISVKVSKVTSALSYQVCLKENPNMSICTIDRAFSDTVFMLNNLRTCQNYTMSLRVNCPNNQVSSDSVLSFQTKGCGACSDSVYCRSSGTTTNEWIDSVSINDFKLVTRKSSGYMRLDSIVTTLQSGKTYRVAMRPAFGGTVPFNEGARVWIDLNQDGDFNDIGEQIAEFSRFTGAVSTNFTVPNMVVEGNTRLRFGMKYVGFSGMPPQYCESFSGGEVRDYCIKLEKTIATQDIWQQSIHVYPNPFNNYFTIKNADNDNKIHNITLTTIEGRLILQKRIENFDDEILIQNIDPLSNGVYFLKIETDKGRFTVKLSAANW